MTYLRREVATAIREGRTSALPFAVYGKGVL
jgi:hypothetical protein